MSNIKPSLIFPIMGLDYDESDFMDIDLSITNTNLVKNPSITDLTKYVNDFRLEHDVNWAIGGYGERRNLYNSSPHFDVDKRDIHLGIDIWGPADSPVFLPMDGVVHSYAYNDRKLDYGYTLIIDHGEILTLYGHLSSSHYTKWPIGQKLRKGTHIAGFGDLDENGGWPPHLHFQCIVDIKDMRGDYPGVCSDEMSKYYFENCPDPMRYINKRS